MKLSDSTQISLPARNLLAILAAVAIGTMSYFTIVERLNRIETTLQLMILKNDMVIQFHEDRIIDLEERKNGNH
mgnify:CR=1 FL=1